MEIAGCYVVGWVVVACGQNNMDSRGLEVTSPAGPISVNGSAFALNNRGTLLRVNQSQIANIEIGNMSDGLNAFTRNVDNFFVERAEMPLQVEAKGNQW